MKRDNDTWIADLARDPGDEELVRALQDLFNILFSTIKWYLSNKMGSPLMSRVSDYDLDQLAQDLAQDALLHIYPTGFRAFRGEACFTTYVKAIALNRARQELRRRGRHREEPWSSFAEDETEQESDDEFLFADHLLETAPGLTPEQQVMLGAILRCLDRLLRERCSRRERVAFIRKYVYHLTSKQIAQLMGTTEGAVNMLLFNARKKLRQGLNKCGYSRDTLRDIFG